MMSIIGLFLAVVWLIMPFVVITIKGKQDRTLELLEAVEKRLISLDEKLSHLQSMNIHTAAPAATASAETDPSPSDPGSSPVIPLA